MQFLSNWQLYGISGVAILGLASYFLGLGAILRIIASITEVLSPLLRGLMEAFVEYTKVLWEGVQVILTSWKAIVVVLTLVGIAYTTVKIPAKIAEVKCVAQKADLNKQITQYKKTYKTPLKPQPFWPWEF